MILLKWKQNFYECSIHNCWRHIQNKNINFSFVFQIMTFWIEGSLDRFPANNKQQNKIKRERNIFEVFTLYLTTIVKLSLPWIEWVIHDFKFTWVLKMLLRLLKIENEWEFISWLCIEQKRVKFNCIKYICTIIYNLRKLTELHVTYTRG
jgi:hypothetical protein